VTLGVVVMAYGTPASGDDIESYYTHIRRGRPPTAEQLDDLRSRYDAIGGISPLLAITRAQAAAIGESLGAGSVVALGQKHAAPFIEDAVDSLADSGATRIVGVVLAPHYSRGSVGEYAARVAEAASARGLEATTVPHWHDLPEWRAFQADAMRAGLSSLPPRTLVVFTAHSLPERVLEGDTYPDQLLESAAAISTDVGLQGTSGFMVAWQSAGRTPDPWRGPDILEVLREVAAADVADGVLVCPQGFTADHLEVLYDLDVQAASVAVTLGLAFARTRSLNADPVVLRALADRIASL
jgi:protoporphyrin/coproporphyrin ferrochelatase